MAFPPALPAAVVLGPVQVAAEALELPVQALHPRAHRRWRRHKAPLRRPALRSVEQAAGAEAAMAAEPPSRMLRKSVR